MVAGAVLAMSFGLSAEVKFGTPFADGMVLQRDRAVPVWGTADKNEKVVVSFGGATVETVADADGKWRVDLPAMTASKKGRELEANGKKVSDVLVGEVWYVSGQSNAEMPLVGDKPHFSDRQGRLVAAMTRNPFIRYCYASNYQWSETPKSAAAYPVAWKPFLPENLGTKPSFSAMGVYFALELYAALDIPIGLVGSYWGGTNIDPWTPRCGYAGKDSIKETANWTLVDHDSWKDENRKGPIHGAQEQPTVLWNEMVEPWCPMAMRGFIWYQGCTNSGEPELYCAKMHALYDGWAEKFANPALKLYFVQLAPFSRSWFPIQLAQAKFAAEEKNAGMVTTGDIGNGDDIHPNEKATIGKRLAALALARDYGFEGLEAEAPTLKGVLAEEGRLVLRFDHADGWYVYNPDWDILRGFEVSGTNGVWHPAILVNSDGGAKVKRVWGTRGIVEGRDLVLESESVTNPVKVRYLHEKPWVGSLFATSGLPLGPFEAEAE